MTKKPAKKTAKRKLAPKPVETEFAVTIPFDVADRINSTIREYFEFDKYKHKVRGKDVCTFDLEVPPTSVVHALKQFMPNSPQAYVAEKFLNRPIDSIFDRQVSELRAFGRAMQFLSGRDEPCLEMELNGIWYPVPIETSLQEGFFGSTFLSVSTSLTAVDVDASRRWWVDDTTFKDAAGNRVRKSVLEILTELHLRSTTPERIIAMRDAVSLAYKTGEQYGRVVDITTSVLVPMEVGWRDVLMPMRFGTEQSPKTAIVENELELTGDSREQANYRLPIVRIFAPDFKRYVYVDVRSIHEHAFDKTAKDRIVLAPPERHVLDAVFNTPPNLIFGDLFRNRHGGIVILAAGPSGTGKTLTSEVYAEYTGRPLYSLEMGELGTNLESVESNLQKIFDRARRWNAVLLFDEVDVFLSERGENIEKAAIVGVFLRLLDQYEGTFFLTTNRPEVIDKAFKSRITVKLDYPPLDDSKRVRVWELLLEAAKFQVTPEDLSWLAAHELNGRNARNATRILRILNPEATSLTREQIGQAIQYIAQ